MKTKLYYIIKNKNKTIAHTYSNYNARILKIKKEKSMNIADNTNFRENIQFFPEYIFMFKPYFIKSV